MRFTKFDPPVQESPKDLPKKTLANIVAQATGESKLVMGTLREIDRSEITTE